ncbi:MAG: hypothetical protein OJF62_002577 [Pseudolabrys sp.]|nr:hypothetical protein [Pseudolabrys sp.]
MARACSMARPCHPFSVMPGHRRSKNDVLKDAYDPGIHEATRICDDLRKACFVE